MSKKCIFVDNTNLFHALKSVRSENGMEEVRLDYIKLVEKLSNEQKADVRFYYSDDTEVIGDFDRKQSRDKFYAFLKQKLGFLMVCLPLRQRSSQDPGTRHLIEYLRSSGMTDKEILEISGQKIHWMRRVMGEYVPEEKGLDCEIVYDMSMLARSGRYDSFTLVSGDEDYARTVNRIPRETGIPVEVAFFGDMCSNKLQGVASKFVDLREVSDLFRQPEEKIVKYCSRMEFSI